MAVPCYCGPQESLAGSKIPFFLGSYEPLAMLGGKIRKCLFSRLQSGKIAV